MLDRVSDGRTHPRIPTSTILRSAFLGILTRLGSLHALAQVRGSRVAHRWVEAGIPSDDTIGRVLEGVDPDSLRSVVHHVYNRLKRNKSLLPVGQGLSLLVLDGHEMHATYRRHCAGCLERTIHTEAGDRVQWYHRVVVAQLVSRDLAIPLDVESQQAGEDEIAAALRLYARVVLTYPRAFDVVLGDALYSDPRFFSAVRASGKDVLTVLKNKEWDIYRDAQDLFSSIPSVSLPGGIEAWDREGFTSWSSIPHPLRIVKTLATPSVRRQCDGQIETRVSEWMWVTTLSPSQASTATAIRFGHARWSIENDGFNQLGTEWHADHLYRHEPRALIAFLLLLWIAFILFQAFFHRNLKPVVRATATARTIGRRITAELYATIRTPCEQPP